MTQVGGRSQSRADSAEPRADLFPGSVSTLHPDAGFGGMGWGRNWAVSAEAGAAEARGNKEATLTSELVPRLRHTLAGPPAVPGSDEKVWLPRRRRPEQGVQTRTFRIPASAPRDLVGAARLCCFHPLSPPRRFALLSFAPAFLPCFLSFCLSVFPILFPFLFSTFFSFFLPVFPFFLSSPFFVRSPFVFCFHSFSFSF